MYRREPWIVQVIDPANSKILSLKVALSKDSASIFDAYCRKYQKVNGSVFNLQGNLELLDWLVVQKQQYHVQKNGYKTCLTEERIKALEWGEFVQDSHEEELNQADKNSITTSKSSSSTSLCEEDRAKSQAEVNKFSAVSYAIFEANSGTCSSSNTTIFYLCLLNRIFHFKFP